MSLQSRLADLIASIGADIKALQMGAGGLVARGVDSMAGNNTPTQSKVITHNLGYIPEHVFITSRNAVLFPSVTARTTTTFTVTLRHTDNASWSSTNEFEWGIPRPTNVQAIPGTNFIEYGPYVTGVTPSIAQDGDTSLTVNHNLNLTQAQRDGLMVVGQLYDGFYASLASWRLGVANANSISIFFGNPSDRDGVTAGLKFVIRVPLP